MKLRNMRVMAFPAPTESDDTPSVSPIALQEEINAWLLLQGEAEYVDIQYLTDGTSFWAFLTWVPE